MRRFVTVYRDTAYLQAANCLLCVHVGTTAWVFGWLLGGYGARLEIATPLRWFGFRLPSCDAVNRRRAKMRFAASVAAGVEYR